MIEQGPQQIFFRLHFVSDWQRRIATIQLPTDFVSGVYSTVMSTHSLCSSSVGYIPGPRSLSGQKKINKNILEHMRVLS